MAGFKVGIINFGEGSFGNPANLVSDRTHHYAAILSSDRNRAIIGRVAKGESNGGVTRTIQLGNNRAQGIFLHADMSTNKLMVELCVYQDDGSRTGEIWDTEITLSFATPAAPTPAPTPAPSTNPAIIAQIRALLDRIV